MEASAAPTIAIRPGQLWRWNFEVKDGTWFFEVVTSSSRNGFLTDQQHVIIKRGDTFTVTACDDPGPARIPGMDLPMLDVSGFMSPAQPPKRWHVVLLGGKLVWIDHESFEQAELITDV